MITSAKQLEKLTAAGRYRDPEVKGLYLQIKSLANRSRVLRYQFDHRPRNMGLGPYPLVSLAKARELARTVRLDIKLDRVDPLAKRREQEAAAAAQRAKVQTFRQAAERFFQKSSAEWKNKTTSRAFHSMMEAYVFPEIGSMSVAAIDTAAVLRVLEPIWKDKPTIAAMLRTRLENILSMATVGGFRSGDNPARWTGHLKNLLPSHAKMRETQSHAALPYRELPGFMAALRAQGGGASAALQFIILTAARQQEALGATWAEIDLEAKLWTVPANRMKGGREHIVPLSDAAVAILASLYREDGNPYVFVGAKAGANLSNHLPRKLLKQIGGADVTMHGFRSSFRDWCGDHTEFPREVAEAALAHAVGDATEQAYRRGTALEKRRALMQAWAAYCSSTPDETGRVVPFKAAGKEAAV